MFGLFKPKRSLGPGSAPIRKFEIWMEGNPNRMDVASKVGEGHGETFNDAVKSFVNKINRPHATMWQFDPGVGCWNFMGRKVFDNHKDASVRCG